MQYSSIKAFNKDQVMVSYYQLISMWSLSTTLVHRLHHKMIAHHKFLTESLYLIQSRCYPIPPQNGLILSIVLMFDILVYMSIRILDILFQFPTCVVGII